MDSAKILFLHGRPCPHPVHTKFAKSLNADFIHVDRKLRWQDRKLNPLQKIYAWFVNALDYPNDYDYFLVDNLHISPIIWKLIRRKKTKIVLHLGSHTIYFLSMRKFSFLSNWLQILILKHYDSIICVGDMSADLAQKLSLKNQSVYSVFLGPSSELRNKLLQIKPNLDSNRILLISNGPTEFRKFYKGLDLMVGAFAKALKKNSNLEFFIVGDWDLNIIDECKKMIPDKDHQKLQFLGKIENVDKLIENSALYLHCSRGDAFPTSSVEAMTAGLVPMVSVWTGTKQIVSRISEELILPLDTDRIADKILWYFDLPIDKKKELSELSRRMASEFEENKAISHYKKTFELAVTNLGSK